MRELNCAVMALCATLASSTSRAQGTTSAHATEAATADSVTAASVRREIVHAWSGYERYAWGHDELLPLSKSYHDWYGHSLLMTPVDALDTIILMGQLTDELRFRI